MEIKLGAFNLKYWQNEYDWDNKVYIHHDLVPGIRVCSASNRKYLGVITDIGLEKERLEHRGSGREYIKSVKIIWLTGSNKGEQQWKNTETLVNYDAYIECILCELRRLKANELEASQTGM